MLPKSLLALAVASFGIGTTEFVITGLLPDVARDLQVSIPSAGYLIGGYALSVAFGTPVMAMALSSMVRKNALLLLVGVFTLGNGLCALAPSYNWLMAARILTALCHGTFFGIGAIVATRLVPLSQRSRAISIMFSGLTLANILGVPAGTALGQVAGWRAAFAAIVPIGVIAGLAVWRWVPNEKADRAADILAEVRVLRSPAVALPMLVSMTVSASLFATFTYISPLLQTVSGITPHGVTAVLLLFGFGITIGNLIGGRLADWRQLPAILGLTVALVAMLLLLGVVDTSPLGATAAVIGWGLVHFACGAPLQLRVVDGAREAPNLASALNQSAFNLGNAIGASLGAQALVGGASYAQLPYLSAGLAAIAVGLGVLDGLLSRRRTEVLRIGAAA